MSIRSFLGAVGAAFKKLFANAPTWAQTASTTITLVAPLASTIVALAAGPDAAVEATQIAHEVQSDLAAVAALIQQSHGGDDSKAGHIRQILTAVSENLGALLTAGHIKNPDTLAKITVPVQLITGELQAILQVLPATPIPPPSS